MEKIQELKEEITQIEQSKLTEEDFMKIPLDDLRAPQFSGWLEKQGESVNPLLWKRRFFVLRDSVLIYYENEINVDAEKEKGRIHLQDVKEIRKCKDSSEYGRLLVLSSPNNFFRIETSHRKYILFAPNDNADIWIRILNDAMMFFQANLDFKVKLGKDRDLSLLRARTKLLCDQNQTLQARLLHLTKQEEQFHLSPQFLDDVMQQFSVPRRVALDALWELHSNNKSLQDLTTLDAIITRMKEEERRKTEKDIQEAIDKFSNHICIICIEKKVDSIFFPCGHYCACYECAAQLHGSGLLNCPVCRGTIISVVRVWKP